MGVKGEHCIYMIFSDGFKNRKESGYTVLNPSTKEVFRVVIPGITNNESELLGLQHAVGIASQGEEIRTDSRCAIAWVKGGRAAARPDLNPICAAVRLAAREKQLVLRWVRREQNLAGILNEQHVHSRAA
jgi:ribonuclease HI